MTRGIARVSKLVEYSKTRGFFTVAVVFFLHVFLTKIDFFFFFKKKFVSKLSLLIFLNIELVENLTI